MSGALYCTGYIDELAEFFEPDKEVVVYHDEGELVEKVRYYLAHPEQAEAVRQAGRRRASPNTPATAGSRSFSLSWVWRDGCGAAYLSSKTCPRPKSQRGHRRL